MAAASSLLQSTIILVAVTAGTWCFMERFIPHSEWSETRREFAEVPAEVGDLPAEVEQAGAEIGDTWHRVSTRVDVDGRYFVKELLDLKDRGGLRPPRPATR